MGDLINKIKCLFKKPSCEHEFAWCRRIEKYQCISGERHYLVCLKCGKVADSRIIKYD